MNASLTLLLSLLPLLAGCSAAPSGQEASAASESSEAARAKPAPDFEAKGLDGAAFKLSSLKGHVVLMDFWATWCEPCRDSAPQFQGFFQKYKSDGLSVVGVSLDAGPEDIPAFLAEHKVSYSIVLDPDSVVSSLYRVRGLPSLFLIDRKGRVRKHWVGWDDSLRSEVEGDIKALLLEKA